MTKRSVKLLPVWLAISSALIIAGIILFALLGFNTSAERKNVKTFEVRYDVVAQITEGAVDGIGSHCEKAFKDNKLSVIAKETVQEIDTNSGMATKEHETLVYTFSVKASDSALAAAKAAVETAIQGMNLGTEDISVSVHENGAATFYESVWRGAVALVVGAIVVYGYVAFRFGLGAALTGITLCAHDVFLTLAVFAIARIPVYAFAPLVFAAVAAVMSIVLWLVQCVKMRENFKDPSYASLSAEDAVEQSSSTARKFIIGIAATVGIVLAISGGVATAGVRLFLLPALIPVAAAVYSALFFGPALHVHVKAAFDKRKTKNKRYVGKAKAEKTAD